MYCPTCGNEVVQPLNYCKSCGANLSPKGGLESYQEPPRVVISFKLVIMFLSIAFVGAIVPIGVITSLYQLKEVGINSDEIAVLLMLTAAIGLGTVALLVWLMMKLVGVAMFESRKKRDRRRTSELEARGQVPVRREIGQALESIPSVTEHTTRTFDRARTTE